MPEAYPFAHASQLSTHALTGALNAWANADSKGTFWPSSLKHMSNFFRFSRSIILDSKAAPIRSECSGVSFSVRKVFASLQAPTALDGLCLQSLLGNSVGQISFGPAKRPLLRRTNGETPGPRVATAKLISGEVKRLAIASSSLRSVATTAA